MKNTIILFNINLPNQPVIIYNNAEIDRLQILSDNKDKAGIYQWTHKESGKFYIGSAVDLCNRLKKYFFSSELKRMKNYISKALILHTHSKFSLTILEYIDISNLSLEEARKKILTREQHYIDSLSPIYNINLIAGSRLGSFHTNETKVLMKEAKIGINRSIETREKISDSCKGILKTKEHKANISKSLNKKVFVYSKNTSILEYEFISYSEAAKYFNCSITSISRYIKSGKLIQNQWIFSLSKNNDLK